MEDNAMSMKESLVPGATRREAMALISGALAGVALGGSAGAQGAPKRGGILRISAFTNPSSLDPTTGGAGSDHAFLFTMYDTLTEWDFDTLKPKPGLAESWSFTDPTTLVLNIRSGVTFHDGTALDAEAVKFNFERNKSDQKSNIKADLSTMASVEVTGPMQVTLKLNTPDAAMPGILSDRAGMMVSPTAVKSSGAGNVARTPVGAGAYAFVSWADGERIVVKRNEKYWKTDRPYPDGIEFAIIPELTTGVRSVTAGQNDLIYQLPPRQKAIVERSNNLKVVNGPTLYVFQIFLNWAKPPFDDVRVRKAFNLAIDRESFVKAALAGLAEPAYMNLPKSHWAYDKSVTDLNPYDPDKARKLLAEAGFKEGTVIEIGGYPDQDSVQRQEILIEQLRKAGRGSLGGVFWSRETWLGVARRLDRAARSKPDLFADVHQGRLLQWRQSPGPIGTGGRDQGIARLGRHRDPPQGFCNCAKARDGECVRRAAGVPVRTGRDEQTRAGLPTEPARQAEI
jgi:peptide/nickel transport system substrate-binding protein